MPSSSVILLQCIVPLAGGVRLCGALTPPFSSHLIVASHRTIFVNLGEGLRRADEPSAWRGVRLICQIFASVTSRQSQFLTRNRPVWGLVFTRDEESNACGTSCPLCAISHIEEYA